MESIKLHTLLVTVVWALNVFALTEALPGEELVENVSYRSESNHGWFLNIGNQKPKSRKRRYASLPEGSNLECKWFLNFPYDSFTLYHTRVSLALPIKYPLPADLIAGNNHNEEEYPLEQQYIDAPLDYQAFHLREGEVLDDEERQMWHTRRRRAARQERSHLYNYLQAAFDKLGVDGRTCVLRTICDVAEAPFEQGLFGEMLNIFLTPSPAGRPNADNEALDYDQYIEAELHGKLNGKCEYRYRKCQISPFEYLPDLLAKVMNN